MVIEKNKHCRIQSTTKARSTLWLSALLIITSFASLIFVSTSFSSSTYRGVSNNAAAPAAAYTQPTQFEQASIASASRIPASNQSTAKQIQPSPSVIPSPAPLSLVALLLIVSASAIRRHQNQS